MGSRTAWIGGALALWLVFSATPVRAQQIDAGYVAYERDNLIREIDALREERASLESQLNSTAGGCDVCSNCCVCADWYDSCACGPTVAYFVAGDGWKHRADGTGSSNFGARFGINTSWNLGGSGVRGQLGGSYGIYDFHGREGGSIQDVGTRNTEDQVFLTLGLSKRASDACCDPWSWGVVYDYMHDDAFGRNPATQNLPPGTPQLNHVDLHQVRFLFGRLMNPCNEIGVWGAFGVQDDTVYLASQPGHGRQVVRPMDQVNLYWRRYWDCGGESMLYVGLGEEQPDNTYSGVLTDDDFSEVVVGLRGLMPLNCSVGLFGNFHYVIPSTTGGDFLPNGVSNSYAEEIWNVSFGLMFVRGCNLPLLPVADNGLFNVQAPAGSY